MVQEQTEKTGDPLDSDSTQLVGNFLQRERLRRQYTIEEVATETCIHIATIKAIEDNNRTKMPAPVFARGFIKLYAEFLSLDSQEIVDRYNNETDQFEDNISDNSDVFFNETLAESSTFANLKIVVGFILVAVILGVAYYIFLYSSPTDSYQTSYQQQLSSDVNEQKAAAAEEKDITSNTTSSITEHKSEAPVVAAQQHKADPEPKAVPEKKEEFKPVVEAKPVVELPATKKPENTEKVAAAPLTATAPPEKKLNLRIEFSERTWMQVALDGAAPEQYLFDPSDESSWNADEKIKLHIGNAGGVRIFLDGKELPVGGMSGSPLLLTIPDDFTSNN